MFKRLCRWWFRLSGWKVVNNIPEKRDAGDIRKYVIIAAPHTSNWDFVYGTAAADLMGLNARFTIKKEWMFFPFSIFFRSLGAIAIDRSPQKGMHHHSMVDVMAKLLTDANEDLVIAITPEATRSRREHWRKGFYYVARNANVPVLLGFLDYANKECGVREILTPSDDIEDDMKKVMQFYQGITPKYPEKFSVDTRYI